MRKIKCLLLAMAGIALPGAAFSAGQYDGIYQVSGDTGYVMMYQTGNNIIAFDLAATGSDGTSISGNWNRTTIGALNGNVATVNVADHVHTQASSWVFNADGSITVTTSSCKPAPGYTGADACDMLGKVVTVKKLF